MLSTRDISYVVLKTRVVLNSSTARWVQGDMCIKGALGPCPQAHARRSLYCDMYLVRYLRYSVGQRVLQMPLSTTARWSYAYRGVPRLLRATTREAPHMAEEQVALLYTRMPPGRQDAATREEKARRMLKLMDVEPKRVAQMVRKLNLLVEGGAMDAFAFSPMPMAVV